MPQPKIDWQRRPASDLPAQAELAQAWDRLNGQRGDLPFMTAQATAAALAVFGSGGEQLLVGRRGAAIAAMFVLSPLGKLRWQTFQPAQTPLGAWVAEAGLALDDLSASLIDGPLGLCLVLSVTQVDPLFTARVEEGDATKVDDYIPTAWVDIQGSFDDYWAARGKNLRQNMRKQRNRLAADHVTTALRVLRSRADVVPALARYGALESAGWKAGGGTAIHPDNDQGRFYRRLFEEAAERGEMVFYEYLFDERTVAINLCLLRGGVLVVLKTTYDESIKSLSPAFLLREEELKAWFAEGAVRRVEYYGRVMDWHTKLTESQRTLYHHTRYRWGWVKRWALSRRAPAEAESAPALAPAED